MRQADDQRERVGIRAPRPHDGPALWNLARDSGLDVNSPYSYLLLCHDFADTCVVAEDEGGAIVGFVTGYRPPLRPDVIFVWQVAVESRSRHRGIGAELVDELVTRSRQRGARYLEATVAPSNDASRRLFESIASGRSASLTEGLLFDATQFPEGDHEDEILLRIGPFGAADPRARDDAIPRREPIRDRERET